MQRYTVIRFNPGLGRYAFGDVAADEAFSSLRIPRCNPAARVLYLAGTRPERVSVQAKQHFGPLQARYAMQRAPECEHSSLPAPAFIHRLMHVPTGLWVA